MAIDLDAVAQQLHKVRDTIVAGERARRDANDRAFDLMHTADLVALDAKIAAAGPQFKLRACKVPDSRVSLYERFPQPYPLTDYQAICADSSLIPPDRHSPLRSYLINVGWASLRYGEAPGADLASTTNLHVDHADLGEIDAVDQTTYHPFDTQRLDVEKSVAEFEMLANLIGNTPFDLPTIAIVDGPLSIYGLDQMKRNGRNWQAILERYLGALDYIAGYAEHRQVTFVGYISYPNTDLVANLIRAEACPYDIPACTVYCRRSSPAQSLPCDSAGTIDRLLFSQLLESGERSALFPLERADVPPMWFCYVNTGHEIARLEMPEWVARDKARVDLAHELVIDQIERGQGFPAVIIEADQRARLDSADRAQYERLILRILDDNGLPTSGSAKSASKRRRGV